MTEVDNIKDMNLWKQGCEDVEMSEIDRGDHIVEKDKYESKGDKEEVEKDDEQNFIQGLMKTKINLKLTILLSLKQNLQQTLELKI